MRANESNHYDLVVTGAYGQRRVQLWSRVAGNSLRLADAPLKPGPVTLTIEAFADRYVFSTTSTDGTAQELGSTATAPLSSESAGGFTGVYLGMFATSGGTAQMPAADFDWFEYRPVGN